jgi:hypothetical protein
MRKITPMTKKTMPLPQLMYFFHSPLNFTAQMDLYRGNNRESRYSADEDH